MFDTSIHYMLPFIAVIDLIVFIHLIGHLIGCQFSSTKIETIAFGLGPTLIRFNKGNMVWRICWIPIGGYIRPYLKDYEGGPCGKYVGVALAGSVLNLAFSILAILFIFMAVGVPAVQDGKAHLAQQSVSDSFIATMRMTVLTWATWNTNTWASIASLFANGWVRLTFLAAIWSSQFGVLNLLPFPRLDGWIIARILLVRLLGVTKANIVLKRIFQGTVALIVLVLIATTYNDLVHLKVIGYIHNLLYTP